MSYFAVIREAGPAWTDGKGITEQPAVSDHAAFMNALADEGYVLFGGPLAGSEHGRLRALLIVNADSEAELHRRLADDPWTPTQQLQITSIESWNIFVGAERLPTAHASTAGRVNIRPQPRAGDAAHRSPPSGQTNRHRHLQ